MPLPNKRWVFEQALDQHKSVVATVSITLDPRHPDAVYPKHLAMSLDNPNIMLQLQYSYRFNNTMRIDDKGVFAVLSFGGVLHDTFVPWDAMIHIREDASEITVQWPMEEVAVVTLPEIPTKPHGLRVVH